MKLKCSGLCLLATMFMEDQQIKGTKREDRIDRTENRDTREVMEVEKLWKQRSRVSGRNKISQNDWRVSGMVERLLE